MPEPQEPAYTVEMWPVDQPIDYPNNPRKYSEADIDEMVEILREYGWQFPIVVDPDGVIVAGHRRRRAARRLGMNTVPVHKMTDRDPIKVRAFRLVENRSQKGGSAWMKDTLRSELQAVVGQAPLITFKPTELTRLLGEKPASVVPEYPIVAKLHEHHDYLVITVSNETDLLWLRQFLEVGQMRSDKHDSQVGIGHVVSLEHFAAVMRKKGALE